MFGLMTVCWMTVCHHMKKSSRRWEQLRSMTFGDVQRRLLYIQKHKYLSYLGLPRGDACNVRIRVLPHVAHLPKSISAGMAMIGYGPEMASGLVQQGCQWSHGRIIHTEGEGVSKSNEEWTWVGGRGEPEDLGVVKMYLWNKLLLNLLVFYTLQVLKAQVIQWSTK